MIAPRGGPRHGERSTGTRQYGPQPTAARLDRRQAVSAPEHGENARLPAQFPIQGNRIDISSAQLADMSHRYGVTGENVPQTDGETVPGTRGYRSWAHARCTVQSDQRVTSYGVQRRLPGRVPAQNRSEGTILNRIYGGAQNEASRNWNQRGACSGNAIYEKN